MKCDGFREESYAQYLLGSASEQTLTEIEAHLRADCETCKQEVSVFSVALHALAMETDEQTPSAALRRKVIRTLQAKPVKSRAQRSGAR